MYEGISSRNQSRIWEGASLKLKTVQEIYLIASKDETLKASDFQGLLKLMIYADAKKKVIFQSPQITEKRGRGRPRGSTKAHSITSNGQALIQSVKADGEGRY